MLCKYFVWFIIYSFIGWIYESAFCAISTHKWENRGFLNGPIIPIYGIGALTLSLLSSSFPEITSSNWIVFLICMAGSAALEYFTSWILEKLFHARWWDYSEVPLNLNGRICFPATIGFGSAGLLILHVIYPIVEYMTDLIPATLLQVIAFSSLLGLRLDLLVTVCALSGCSLHFAHTRDNVFEQEALL